MSPIATQDLSDTSVETIASLKARVAESHAAVNERKPVADDYMYDFKYNAPLPFLGKEATEVDDASVQSRAEDLVQRLSEALKNKDAEAFSELFLPNGVWRDKVVFTWEYRTFNGVDKIKQAAQDLLPLTEVLDVALISPAPKVERPYSDLEFIQVNMALNTDVAGASVVANLVNTSGGLRIWTMHTAIESLHRYPEMPNRDGHMIGDLSWHNQRLADHDFEQHEPEVVIIGGGHNGLMMAARFKALGIPALIIERNRRIGDNWRGRYEALSLHFPHWADHLPYMPYPDHWPIYTPAGKLGDYLEWYYSALELYAWCDSTVEGIEQKQDGSWSIKVSRRGQGNRTVSPKHLVIATSLAGVPMSPVIPGREQFKGTVRHSTEHDSSRHWIGKKVLVVGTSSSGFDTAYDFARRDIDVTILQRSPTYIMSLTNAVPKFLGSYEPKDGERPNLDMTDRLSYSMPVGPGEELGRRAAEELEQADAKMLASLQARGFRTWRGQRGTGVQTLGYTKNGGFYFEAGACEQIINGKIKVQQGAIERFTENGVVLTNGFQDDYDLVVLATGFSNTIHSVRAIVGDEIASRCKPIWGIDEEGELNSAWKDCGVPNLWIMVGTLQHGRYHSKKVALRIKAMLEGIAGAKYEK